MTWALDLQDNDGGAVASDVVFRLATATWALDGSGSLEVDLKQGTEDEWVAGQRRAIVRDGATPWWGGWMTRTVQSGGPKAETFKSSGLGLSSRLSRRLVHGDFSQHMVPATDIAWALISHAQAQTAGDLGFTLGSVDGTAPSRSRDYCDGDVVGDAIGELAAFVPGGFDWEIDPTGAFNAWVGGRGSATGRTIAPADVRDWGVESETVDLATYATGIGTDPTGACGAPVEVVSSDDDVATYGRCEIPVAVDSNDSDELADAAAAEIAARLSAGLVLTASWIDGRGPWDFGEVWLGDTLTADFRACFGGPQLVHVTDIKLALEPGHMAFVEYGFERV